MTEPSKEVEHLNTVLEQDTQVLYQASTMFPFDIFPKKVVVYLTHVDIIDSIFFGTKEVQSILVKDIYSVEVMTTPFMSSITIVNRQITIPEITIEKLSNGKAKRLRNILQGLVIATGHETKLLEIDTDHLLEKLEELGATQATT